jgi:SEC-C motif-containing protein
MGTFGEFAGPVGSCPCGAGVDYTACCGPLHAGEREATSAVELLRSRYVAYVVGDAAYLTRTWHPRTRPAVLDVAPDSRWTGLEVLRTDDGREGDPVGVVEFVAGHADEPLHERSRFVRRAGRWVYVDGDVLGAAPRGSTGAAGLPTGP